MTVASPERGGCLTPRELEVARLVASGLRNAAIAEVMGISVVTVKNHLARTMQKLDVQSRMEVMLFVLNR